MARATASTRFHTSVDGGSKSRVPLTALIKVVWEIPCYHAPQTRQTSQTRDSIRNSRFPSKGQTRGQPGTVSVIPDSRQTARESGITDTVPGWFWLVLVGLRGLPPGLRAGLR